jgi:16S rRNA G527 N7-methylase RsmG
LHRLGWGARARVVAERFEKTEPPEADYLTCRALERFTEMLPAMLAWSRAVRTLLLFGGPALRVELERAAHSFDAVRLPDTEQRYLFVVRRA